MKKYLVRYNGNTCVKNHCTIEEENQGFYNDPNNLAFSLEELGELVKTIVEDNVLDAPMNFEIAYSHT